MAEPKVTSVTRIFKYVAYLALVFLFCLLILRQRDALVSSLEQIVKVNPMFVIGGVAVLLLSVVASAGVYVALSPKQLSFKRTLLVQMASLGVNRLLPSGSGALGISYLYLRAHKLSKLLSASVAAGNNLLGFLGHILLLVSVCLVFPNSIAQFTGISLSSFGFAIAGAGIAIAAVIVLALLARKSTYLDALKPLLQRPNKLMTALWCSLAITLCYVLAVMVAAAALDYMITPAEALIVLSFGVLAASAVPVPGGVGAAEAGLYFGLHSYGMPAEDALAVAILYRVMTFWIPLFIGVIAFFIVSRRGLLASRNSRAN